MAAWWVLLATMSGRVPAARSDSPGWLSWLTVTVLILLGVLLTWLLLLQQGAETSFLVVVGISVVLAAVLLPAWAVYGLDRDEE